MPATREDISDWFDRGAKDIATHMIVVCDTFAHDDHPVFVYPSENVHELVKQYDGRNMYRVMEVYDLRMDKFAQMAEHRAFHY